MRKKFARFLGRKLPYFIGKHTIIRFLYPPTQFKNIYAGEKFIDSYFGKKYEGITSNYIDWGVYFCGGLESGLVNYIKTEIKNFNYFLDIGSNTGTISLPFAHQDHLKIICFEPLEYSYKKLIKNYEINQSLQNHYFHKIALSNKDGESNIYYSEIDDNIGTASLDKNWDFKDKIEIVKTKKLDGIYNFKNKNIFIKIDVENHEKEVIEGSINFLKNNKILMYLETRNKELLNYLKDLNFSIRFAHLRENSLKFSKKQHGPHVLLKTF